MYSLSLFIFYCVSPQCLMFLFLFFCSDSNPVLISSPPELAGMTLEARLISYDWENQFGEFQEATRKGSFKPICWGAKNHVVPVSKQLRFMLSISQPKWKSQITNQATRQRQQQRVSETGKQKINELLLKILLNAKLKCSLWVLKGFA